MSQIKQLLDVVWSNWLIYFCLLTGVYFTLRTGFLQVRLIKPMLKSVFDSEKSDRGISSFQSLSMALSGRIGTGNIAGVGLAIFLGGPGALFWMWVLAFFGAASSFIEGTLAQIWKVEIDGAYRGGPAFYIEKGTKMKWYAVLFAILTLVCAGFLLPSLQAATISEGIRNSFGLPNVVTSILAASILIMIIFGGIRRIASFAEIVVPFMTILYVLLAVIIVFMNITKLPSVLALIFGSAFSLNSTFGGIAGSAFAWGIRRGIFSNEAGQGSGAHAGAASEVTHPVKQGLVQAFSVYIDTFLVCSATGFMILLTKSYNVINETNNAILAHNLPKSEAGVAYTQIAVNKLFSGAGTISPVGIGGSLVSIALVFFAFTTILSYYYIAETNISYLFKTKKSREFGLLLLRLSICISVVFSALKPLSTTWALGDIGSGLMFWANLIAILILQKPALKALEDFEAQYKKGEDPVFVPDKLGIKDADLWKTINKKA